MISELSALWGTGAPGVVASVLVLLALAVFVAVGSVLFVIDVREHRLPNAWVGRLAAGVLLPLLAACLVQGSPVRAGQVLLAGVVAVAAFACLYGLSRGGLGMGDVKLSGVLGALAGYASWGHVAVAGVLTAFIGGMHAAVVMIRTRDRRAHIAFGPAMLAGTFLALLL